MDSKKYEFSKIKNSFYSECHILILTKKDYILSFINFLSW